MLLSEIRINYLSTPFYVIPRNLMHAPSKIFQLQICVQIRTSLLINWVLSKLVLFKKRFSLKKIRTAHNDSKLS